MELTQYGTDVSRGDDVTLNLQTSCEITTANYQWSDSIDTTNIDDVSADSKNVTVAVKVLKVEPAQTITYKRGGKNIVSKLTNATIADGTGHTRYVQCTSHFLAMPCTTYTDTHNTSVHYFDTHYLACSHTVLLTLFSHYSIADAHTHLTPLSLPTHHE